MENLILFDEIINLKSVNSTSKYAEKLVKKNEVSGNFLVIAERQSNGLGRDKNRWFSPKNGLYLTAGLYGLLSSSSLTIFSGICLHKALKKLFPKIKKKLKIKWPNDIYLGNKKLCGVLSQKLSVENYHLIGIGLNTNIAEFPDELKESATSLRLELQREVSNEDITKSVFTIFAEYFPDFIENGLDLKYYKKHSLLIGKQILLDTNFEQFSGKVINLNKDGALLLRLSSGMIQPFYAGSVVKF